MGDRIAVMQDGVIHQCDQPLGLYERPVNRFVAGFIGSPPMNFLHAQVQEAGGELWVSGEGFRAKIDTAHRDRLGEYVGQAVTFGIRPTDVYEQAMASGAIRDSCLQVEVEVVEPMGAHTLVYLNLRGQSLVASLDSATQAIEGEELAICLDMSKAHYFDTATELSIL